MGNGTSKWLRLSPLSRIPKTEAITSVRWGYMSVALGSTTVGAASPPFPADPHDEQRIIFNLSLGVSNVEISRHVSGTFSLM